MPPLQLAALWLLAIFMVAIGVLHFVRPKPFVRIVPKFLPAPLALVYISGFFEILGGIGLLIPETRAWAAWGLIALYIAVFPANIYMLTTTSRSTPRNRSRAGFYGHGCRFSSCSSRGRTGSPRERRRLEPVDSIQRALRRVVAAHPVHTAPRWR